MSALVMLRDFIRRLRCRHEWQYERGIYGDEGHPYGVVELTDRCQRWQRQRTWSFEDLLRLVSRAITKRLQRR